MAYCITPHIIKPCVYEHAYNKQVLITLYHTSCVDIYILRHGKAEAHTPTISGDHQRQLTESGRIDMEVIAKAIKNMHIEFDSIVSSPLVRAGQTAEIVAKRMGHERKSIKIWEELKPEMDVSMTIKRLLDLKPGFSVLLVGHEPHLSSLIHAIISGNKQGDSRLCIILKKGGFAHLRADKTRQALLGCLKNLLAPKQLRSMS